MSIGKRAEKKQDNPNVDYAIPNEGNTYKDRRNRYNRYRAALTTAKLICIVLVTALMWIITLNPFATMTAGLGIGGMIIIAWLEHRLDDRYISGIIVDVTLLIDMLTELKEREIFPYNEETLVSKLQNKLVKLTNILRKKNALAEQDKEKLKALVSDISHQLKIPIANLRMYTDFLQDEGLTADRRREYTEVLKISVERLTFLSESMIKISRLESGLIHLNKKKQSLNETVLRAIRAVYTKAKNAQVEIRYRCEADVCISHDSNWTSEAIFNLLDNGVKYAAASGVLDVRLRRLGSFVVVEVEDENGAIPESEQAKIFTRFYRGENSLEKEGIGVGLYLAREITVAQGGYMNLKTTRQGNIFSIYLQEEITNTN